MWLAKLLVGILAVLVPPKGIQGSRVVRIHDGMTFTRTGAAQFFDNYHTIVISIKKEDVNGAVTKLQEALAVVRNNDEGILPGPRTFYISGVAMLQREYEKLTNKWSEFQQMLDSRRSKRGS